MFLNNGEWDSLIELALGVRLGKGDVSRRSPSHVSATVEGSGRLNPHPLPKFVTVHEPVWFSSSGGRESVADTCHSSVPSRLRRTI